MGFEANMVGLEWTSQNALTAKHYTPVNWQAEQPLPLSTKTHRLMCFPGVEDGSAVAIHKKLEARRGKCP
ncbi:hypothetical protein ACO3_20012 [Thiomonas arsenitoxydans]|nr:hypothetical protein ACO3_20012 [Thiomonas arsenitoxydans]